jgi:diguanylate cyclase (GGDEF)-like protein
VSFPVFYCRQNEGLRENGVETSNLHIMNLLGDYPVLSIARYPESNKLSIWTTLMTLLGMILVARAVILMAGQPTARFTELIEIGAIFLLMAPWSVQLPSGASWRPAMPLVMISIFVLPPPLTAVVAIPGLIMTTARAKGSWWKYPQTFAHVGLGLYSGALVYRFIALVLGRTPLAAVTAMVSGVVVHLLVNRVISALIVAERTHKSLGEQIRLSLKELHLGYLNSYLTILMAGLLYPFYGSVTLVLAAIAQIGLMRAVSYYSSARQLQHAATVDGLTGVENRSAWENFAASQAESLIHGNIVVIDMDGFKLINDQFGHLVGDGVIHDLAQSIYHLLPKRARMFRYGGDEFVIYDPKATPDSLRAYIVDAVSGANEEWETKGINVGISIGSATGPEDGRTLSDLFSVADARMYEDKHRHRMMFDGLEVGISETVLGLIAATETRDQYTAGHNLRVAFYALELAKHFRLESQKLKSIFRGSIVHDIGKIGIPDALLNKPGALTTEERQIVEAHPQIGYDMCTQLGFSADELAVIRFHHEKWNGTGYPLGLKEEGIPLVARIVALADIYDALTSDRAYRNSWSHDETMNYIIQNSGILFDPACVEAWIASNQNSPLLERQPAWIRQGGVAEAVARMATH